MTFNRIQFKTVSVSKKRFKKLTARTEKAIFNIYCRLNTYQEFC